MSPMYSRSWQKRKKTLNPLSLVLMAVILLPFCISWSMKSSMTSRVTSRTLSTGTLRWK